MKTAGARAMSTAPNTMRERSRAPSPLLPWPAYTLRMFLSSSTSMSSNNRKTSTVRPVKMSVSPAVSGLRKLTPEVLNACSAPSSTKISSTPLASRATVRRRGSPLNSMGRL